MVDAQRRFAQRAAKPVAPLGEDPRPCRAGWLIKRD